jgi:hypothetical protein
VGNIGSNPVLRALLTKNLNYMGFLIYLIGLVLAFVINTVRLYYIYKKEYYVEPTLKGVLHILDKTDHLDMYIFGTLLYIFTVPILLIGYICKLFARVVEKIVNRILGKTRAYRILAKEIAELHVGSEIEYTTTLELKEKLLKATITEIDDEIVTIKTEGCVEYKGMSKNRFFMHEGTLILDLYIP